MMTLRPSPRGMFLTDQRDWRGNPRASIGRSFRAIVFLTRIRPRRKSVSMARFIESTSFIGHLLCAVRLLPAQPGHFLVKRGRDALGRPVSRAVLLQLARVERLAERDADPRRTGQAAP